jgi:steroid delta-isomerase-like uncharacterized protein
MAASLHLLEPRALTFALMTTEANKAVVRRFIREIFEEGRAEALDELVAPDFVRHADPSGDTGRDELRAAMNRVSKGLADVAFTIEAMIAEGDRVAVRLTSKARQVGEFIGIPPSGRSYTIGEIHIFRVHDGKIAEHWHEADFLGMMRQLGALPGGPGG